MKRFLISFLVLFFVSFAGYQGTINAQDIQEEWVARYHLESNDEATAIAVDNSGNVYVTGTSQRVVDEVLISEYATIKYNASGTQEWIARYSGTTPRNSFAKAIALDNSGNVYVTGRSTGAGTGLDYATIKYVQILNVAPLPPSNLTALADTFGVILNWQDNSDNEIGFIIERKDDSLHIPGTWVIIDSVGVDISIYNDIGLSPNTTYSYRVSAYNEFGTSIGDSVDVMTMIPVELTSFTAKADNNTVTLNWTTVTELNNSGFQIERSNGSEYQTVGFVSGHGTSTNVHNYTFMDQNVEAGTYTYRLKQMDLDGTFEYSNAVEVEVFGLREYTLGQNYPNPFNPSTTINFSLATDSKVSLKIFNVLGQEVAALINGQMSAGSQKVSFDASSINSGVYFYRLDADGIDGQKFSSTKKMILTK